MWDDVIIGTGNKGSSALLTYFPGNQNISENNVSYWISNVFLDIGMTIFKNTLEGQQLYQMINNRKSIDVINDFLIDLMLKNINADVLKRAINTALQRSYKDGQNAKADEIRIALGISS